MRWRHERKIEMKQEKDLEVIKQKDAEHQAVYQQQLQHKRMIGRRYRLSPPRPTKKMTVETEDPRLNIIVKGSLPSSFSSRFITSHRS